MTASLRLYHLADHRARKCGLMLADRPAQRLPRGFSLIELLTVTGIMGVMIALLLPAVQQAREASRRIGCVNNLKQLALATQAYTDAFGILPPAGIVEPKTVTDKKTQTAYPVFDQRSGKMFSWAVLLLRFLEQGNLYDQFDTEASVLEQPNEPQSQSVEVYLCPSDSAAGRFYMDEKITKGKWFAKGNYATYVSPVHTDLQLLYPGALIATGQKLVKIIDGTSNTIVFSEVRTLSHLQDERGAWALPWNGASLLAVDMHHDINDGRGWFTGFSPDPRYAYQVQLPNTLGPNADVLVSCPPEVLAEAQGQGMPCTRSIYPLGIQGYVSAASRSNHVGGVNVAFLDGHVGFLADGVDPFTLAYLVDIRDEQVIANADE